jgi:hypothetical protein
VINVLLPLEAKNCNDVMLLKPLLFLNIESIVIASEAKV